MKLGVWARIGIVASVLWMVIAPFYLTSRELTDWQTRTTAFQELCLRLTEKLPAVAIEGAYENCADEARKSTDAMVAARWSLLQGSIGLAVAGLIAAWLTAAVIYGTVRWVLNGRRNIRKPD
jgi:hypothetical protein